MIRLRNEALILQDTLDHLASFADAIVVFDDASFDNSVELAKQHPAVVLVIENKRWNGKNRPWEETSNRAKLLRESTRLRPEWLFYCDADERFDGDVRELILSQHDSVTGIRMNLFDAYLTETDHAAYVQGTPLLNFRASFGPERRKILVAWKANQPAKYRRIDTRAPEGVDGEIVDAINCQHYGKGISVEQWESTCDYYIEHFPEYADKWRSRKGHAVHQESDFGRPLYPWAQVAEHAIDIA